MTHAKALEEAVRLVADGDRVIVTINGVQVGMIPADEVADIEAMEDRYWAKEAEKALAEPGEPISLDDYLKEREAERSARRGTRKARRERVERQLDAVYRSAGTVGSARPQTSHSRCAQPNHACDRGSCR